MISMILNGIFTEDYFLDSIKLSMAEYILNKKSPGLLNKIRVSVHKNLYSMHLHYHKVVCDESNNREMNLINLLIDIQPTILSSIHHWSITMPLYHWPDEFVQDFSTDQLIEIYTEIPFICERIAS